MLKAWLLLVMLQGGGGTLKKWGLVGRVKSLEHDIEERALSLGLCSLSPAAMGLASLLCHYFHDALLPHNPGTMEPVTRS